MIYRDKVREVIRRLHGIPPSETRSENTQKLSYMQMYTMIGKVVKVMAKQFVVLLIGMFRGIAVRCCFITRAFHVSTRLPTTPLRPACNRDQVGRANIVAPGRNSRSSRMSF